MKIIFMGTPDFAVPCLRALIENKHDIVGVVCQPDKPKGRGNKLTPPPIKDLANEYNLRVFQPEKARDKEFIEELKNINPDLIVVVAYGHILPKAILDIPRLGCINIHGSLLPKYRGAAPIQWAIINGEKTTGVTSMYMDVGMDTGDMILKSEIEILDEDTSESLFDKLSGIGAEVLIDTIKLIEDGNAPREKQDESMATIAPMLDKEMGNINWSKSAKEIFNLVRGTYPWPGAYTCCNCEKIKIFNVEIQKENTNNSPGTIVEVLKDSIVVQTGDGLIKINEIQAPNCKRMDTECYLLGHCIIENSKLGE